jgi:hypothetical protein
MQDPHTPEILAWVDAMPILERLTVMHAMSVAFPILKNDRAWTAKVSAVLVELKPSKRQHEDILNEAGRISGRLKRELTGGR